VDAERRPLRRVVVTVASSAESAKCTTDCRIPDRDAQASNIR
jgi:hypothetical protein